MEFDDDTLEPTTYCDTTVTPGTEQVSVTEVPQTFASDLAFLVDV
jgi:hypothetical protein